MKKIDDDRLVRVEEFVRQHGLEKHLRKLSGADYDPECEVDVGDEILTEVFGEFYKSDPTKFCFRDGDKCLIFEIVEQLKRIVDKNGINSGLYKFKMKTKKPRKRYNPIDPKCNLKFDVDSNNECGELNSNVDMTANLPDLKSYLLQKVETCLRNHGADELIGTDSKDLIDEETVDVVTAGDQIYGNITCLICQHQNKKNNRKKRVSYYRSKEKCYWVMSNFTKHLTNFHRLSSIRGPKKMSTKANSDEENNINKTNDLNEIDDDDSVFVIEEVAVEMKPPKIERDANFSFERTTLYNQLAHQIGEMIGEVILHDDQQDQMQFYRNENMSDKAQLTVAKIPGDGNCLFSAIVHQIWHHEIDSAEHETATSQFRKYVVDYILHPENFRSFEYHLQDRVYEYYERKSKQKSKIINMRDECKKFVRDILSKDGEWGGYETMVAASKIHSTNIIVIDELGSCYISGDTNKMHARTIALAYRMGANNIRNHYESVCDIGSTNIYKIVDLITKRMK